ncbi:MAG: hypothetical protein IJ545_08070 [Alphaproteobacteria bacterium]|nr:hypothetical protein [Alphaproteobacteria bacterium]
MFNFFKKKPEQNGSITESADDNNLANILGAQENDTNITAGVDAILDDDAEITESGINSENLNFSQYDEPELSNPPSFDDHNDTEKNSDLIDEEEQPNEVISDLLDLNEPAETVTDIDTVTEPLFSSEPEFEQNDTSFDESEQYAVSEQEYETNNFSDTQDETEVESELSSVPEYALNADDEVNPDVEPIYAFNDFNVDSVDEIPETTPEPMEDSSLTETQEQQDILSDNPVSDVADDVYSTAEFNGENITDQQMNDPVLDFKDEDSFDVTEITLPQTTNDDEETFSGEICKVSPNSDLWTVDRIGSLSENAKVINSYTQFETWEGDKYQDEIALEIKATQDLNEWSVLIMNHYIVPLKPQISELIIDRQSDTVRYASLMREGSEKLKIFNQSHYKFIMPQNNFFTVQGNVICGHIEETDTLDVLDYVKIPLGDKVNQRIGFKTPASGIILGPTGTQVYFSAAKALSVCVEKADADDFINEYIPSVKDFDSRQSFVYGETSQETEFNGSEQQNKLVINVGSSLYGWYVRFDNEKYMSLRDVLDYQMRYKKLPSANGEVIHDNKILRFFGVQKMQAREKTIYYSYGKM